MAVYIDAQQSKECTSVDGTMARCQFGQVVSDKYVVKEGIWDPTEYNPLHCSYMVWKVFRHCVECGFVWGADQPRTLLRQTVTKNQVALVDDTNPNFALASVEITFSFLFKHPVFQVSLPGLDC